MPGLFLFAWFCGQRPSASASTAASALQAVTWRRLLISSWPWRSAGYLLTILPVALAAAALLAIPAVPWLVLAARLTAGSDQAGVIVVLALLGAALIAALGPLIAMPLAGLERRRLHLGSRRYRRPDPDLHDRGPSWRPS